MKNKMRHETFPAGYRFSKNPQRITKIFGKKFVGFFVLSFVVLFSVLSLLIFVSSAKAATGINREINFQGKLVDNNGLNVPDNTYTVVFSLYSVSTSGTAIWTETDSVTTKSGVFQVQLGAGTALPDNVVFNSDSLWLGIKVGSDAEMTPRIRFTAVPYAINSASLDGVVATQSATGFNLQGGTSSQSTLSFINNGTALVFQPGVAEGLTLQSNGANGLSLDTGGGAAINIGSNNATSVAFGKNSNNTSFTFNNGTGGFTVGGTGSITLSALNTADGLIYTSGTNGILLQTAPTGGSQCLQSNSGNTALAWIACSSLGTIYWQESSGVLAPFNITDDLLLGGTATTSAKFAVLNIAGNTPTASISANPSAAAPSGLTLSPGAIQSLNNTTLTLGGTTTGDIAFRPGGKTVGSSLYLASNGNVGIGTTTPASDLSIVDNVNDAVISLKNGNATGLQYASLSVTNNANQTIDFQVYDNLASGTLYGLSKTSFSQIDSGASGGFAIAENATGAPIVFVTNSIERGRIDSSGNLGIGTTNPLATLDVRGNTGTTPVASLSGATTFANTVLDQSGSGDIFTASRSGATKFTILNNGNVSLTNYNSCGLLTTSGTVLTCSSLPAGFSNYWQLNSGALAPFSTTSDLLLGSTATTSAKFAFVNVAGGTPTASLSANPSIAASSGLTLSPGAIQSLNMGTLTIGGSSTGNIVLNPNNGNNGFLTMNVAMENNAATTINLTGTNPVIESSTANNNLTLAAAGSGTVLLKSTAISGVEIGSVAGTPQAPLFINGGIGNNGALIINNNNSGDLVDASQAGNTKFVINNSGSVGIGTSTPTAVLDVAGAASVGGQLTFRFGTATIQSSENQSLTIGGNTTGNIIINPTGGNYTGIGTASPLASLDIRETTGLSSGTIAVASVSGKSSFAALVVNNSGNGDLFSASSSGVTQFNVTQGGNVNMNGTLTAKGRIVTTGGFNGTCLSGGTTFNADKTTGACNMDVSEIYPSTEDVASGDVVMIDPTATDAAVTKADQPYGQSVMGIVTTHPGIILGIDGSEVAMGGDTTTYMENADPRMPAIALDGKVPVKVSSMNGPIAPGDPLTASSLPGVAMKATVPGYIIGKALESYNGDPSTVGSILTFVNISWDDPTVNMSTGGNYDLLQNSDLSLFDQSNNTASTSGVLQTYYTIQDGAGIAVTSTTALAKATIANIQAGAIIAKQISTDQLNVTTGNITLGGKTFDNYITDKIKQTLSKRDQTISFAASVNGLITATQSAQLVKNILVQHDLSATVSGMIISGVLGANTIDTKNISGLVDLSVSSISTATLSAQTITADTIKANHIEGLDIITTGLQKDDARITALESIVATQSAPIAPTGIIASPTAGLAELNTNTIQTIPSGDLRVKGNALVEGIFHVVDTLFANNFIANGVSDFFGNVIFHTGVTFQQTPTFTNDTAGIAVVKKGADHIAVTFFKAYDQIPVINASITTVSLTPTPSETPNHMQQRQEEIEKTLLADNIHFIITDKTINGFTILLDRQADEDIAFSWLALSVNNPVIFQSDQQDPSPTDALSPSPIDTIIPTVATTSAGL